MSIRRASTGVKMNKKMKVKIAMNAQRRPKKKCMGKRMIARRGQRASKRERSALPEARTRRTLILGQEKGEYEESSIGSALS
ncbi:hypothetical protein Tco_0080598 [Tanacetum coccineum]